MDNKIERRWFEFWQRIGAEGDPYPVYGDLVRRYSEPLRYYHNLSHTEFCLEEFDFVRDFSSNPDRVEMAIWYHDAVYDTRSSLNEKKSAQLAAVVARRAMLPEIFVRQVRRLILATSHKTPPKNLDSQVIVDVDLSILGQPEEIFEEYERQIRNEYAWVPEIVFNAERSSFLKAFLRRETIYSMGYFQDKYESQARRNILRSINRLAG